MSDFGDVRSAVQANDEAALKVALLDYDDKMPAEEVIAYIRKAWGWCPAHEWQGSRGRTTHAVFAHRHGSRTPLLAWAFIGNELHPVAKIDRPEFAIQPIILPKRREALDLGWMPWAKQRNHDSVTQATQLLYACVDSQLRESVNLAHDLAMFAVFDRGRESTQCWVAKQAVWIATLRSAYQAVCRHLGGQPFIKPEYIDRMLLGGKP